MSARGDALDEIVATARAHGLTADEISAALARADDSGAAARAPGVLARLFAYLGGTFVFAGFCVLIALNWETMSPAARIVTTLGAGLAVFAAAMLAARDARLVRAQPPLFLAAAALQGSGILVAMDELSTGGDASYAVLVMSLVMLAQQALAFARVHATTLVFTMIAFGTGAVTMALDIVGASSEFNGVVTGVALVLVALGLARGPHRAIAPFWQLAGAAACLVGLFELLRDTPVEPAYLLAACGTVVLSAQVRSRALLAAGTLATLGYVSYFTEQRFVDSLGWPLVLIVLGLVLIGVSGAAVRFDRRYIADAS